jgi:hypothetical protein
MGSGRVTVDNGIPSLHVEAGMRMGLQGQEQCRLHVLWTPGADQVAGGAA